MADDVSLHHLLRALKKVPRNILEICHFNMIFLNFNEKNPFLKL
jgi:hypothetical protein